MDETYGTQIAKRMLDKTIDLCKMQTEFNMKNKKRDNRLERLSGTQKFELALIGGSNKMFYLIMVFMHWLGCDQTRGQ